MPILTDKAEGRKLFELLAVEVQQLSFGEQIQVGSALKSGNWDRLSFSAREAFARVDRRLQPR